MSETSETTEQPTGIAWGDPITPERLAQLREMFERQKIWAAQPDRNIEQSVFRYISLTGADVFWLAVLAASETTSTLGEAARILRETPGFTLSLTLLHLEGASLSGVQLREARLRGAQLKGVFLREALLERANLSEVQLEGADLENAQLEGANLERAQLEGAFLREAQLNGSLLFEARLKGASLLEARLEGANLTRAQLEEADLESAQLQRANLAEAQLGRADLRGARLQQSILHGTQLEGANLEGAQLQGADLRGASFDKASRLTDAKLNEAHLDQAIFDNTNLAVIRWEILKLLGEERRAKEASGVKKKATAFHTAARAYRSLSVALRNQGLSTDATRFHYRAELMERKSYFWQIFVRLGSRRFYTAPAYFGRWLFSWLLGTFAGYGDYFGRLLLTYVLVVSAFAGLMFLASGRSVSFDSIRDVFVLSVTSFHGRGVQPPGLHLNDGLATLTAVEAFFGLLIEGIFIAAFTRRVTGN